MFTLSSVRRRILRTVFLFGFTALLGGMLLTPNLVNAQTDPGLGTASPFAILAGSTVTNTGPSVVIGNIGVSPGSSITGFPPGTLTGTTHANDAIAIQAQIDATAAYNRLASEPCTRDLTGQDLGAGATPPLPSLTSGVYCFTTSAQLIGALTLTGGGGFVFKIGSTLTTASGSSVLVANGASDCNVYWQVGSSATIGTSTSFAGNILALTSITLTTSASVTGRALAQTGAVTLDSNNAVGSSGCASRSALSLTKNDGGVTSARGSTIPYTLSFQNTGNVALANVILTDAIPADTTFNAGASTPGWNCSVNPCTFALGTLLPEASGSAIFAVTVISSTDASIIRNTASIASGATSATASDTTPVRLPAAAAPPSVPPQNSTAVPTVASSAPQAVGLPNTGGGAPQPTYWIGEPGR